MSQPPPPDYLDIAVKVFTILGAAVAYLAGFTRLRRWWHQPPLTVENVGIFYTAVASSPSSYNYQDSTGAHMVMAIISVDFVIKNTPRRWKKKTHATGVRWAVEISDAKTGTQVYSFYQDTYSTILGPNSVLPLSQVISKSLFNPEYRVYVNVDSKEGSSVTYDKVVKVARRQEPTVGDLLRAQFGSTQDTTQQSAA